MALLYAAMPASRDWSWLVSLTLAPVDAQPALAVAWTLQHEILFYILFGLFYYSGLLIPGLAVWALTIFFGPDHLPFRLINLEFFFGIAACLLYRARLAHPALMLMAVPLLSIWALLGPDDGQNRVLVGAALATIIAPLAQWEQNGRLTVPKALVLLGAASYSLYLVHTPLISAVARMSNAPGLTVLAGIGVSLLGGFAYYFAIERHVIRLKPAAAPAVPKR